MSRTTKAELVGAVNHLNHLLDKTPDAYTKGADGKYRANPGTYTLDWSYGGVRLDRITNEGGGVSTISHRGTKGQVYSMVWAIINTLYAEGLNK